MAEQQKYKYISDDVVHNVYLEKVKYANGQFGLVLMKDPQTTIACASVHLTEYDLEPNEIIVKTWGGNERMLEFLTMNHIVEVTGREVTYGFTTLKVCRLLI
jgi:hypothetical protein